MSDQNAVSELRRLTALQQETEASIATVRAAAKAQLREGIEKQATEAGYTLQELFGVKVKKPRKASTPWTDPNDKSKVWQGQGKRPAWVKELLDAGFTQEQLQAT